MAAAEIGASASNYTGNAGIGGGVVDAIKIDSKPVEQLMYYTMLYNKAEYDQRQKDAESAAKEIADLTSYDLTTGIEKDAKILQQEYDALTKYAKENPDAVNYRNKEKWMELKKKRNELLNNIQSAKVRHLMFMARKKEIADEKDPELKRIMEEELNSEIEKTDIKTPLGHSQKYDISMPEMPKGTAVTFDVYKKGANQDFKRDYSLWDVKKASQKATIFELNLNGTSSRKIIKEETHDRGLTSVVFEENGLEYAFDYLTKEEYEKEFGSGYKKAQALRRNIASKNNPWLKSAEAFTASIAEYKDQNGEIDESRLPAVQKNLIDLVKQTNEYLATKKSEIKSGAYTDKFGKGISFGDGMLGNEADYDLINYKDGITAAELAKVMDYATFAGDSYKTTAIQTDNAIQYGQLAVSQKNAETSRMAVNKKEGGGSGTPAPGLDEPERRVQDFVTSYTTAATNSGKAKVPASQLDEYTKKALEIGSNQEVIINGNNIEIYDGGSSTFNKPPVRVISLDGAKTVVSDILFPKRTGKEEKNEFGAKPKTTTSINQAEDKWKSREVN